MEQDKYQVINNEADNQFEIHLGEETAFMIYEFKGSNIILESTFVPKELERQGIGSALVEAAFEAAKEMDKKVIVICPFTTAYVAKHPILKEQMATSGS